MSWFENARLGIFIHWGHSSQNGVEISWPLVGGVPTLPQCQKLSIEDYYATAATFSPQDDFPTYWTHLFKQMKVEYVVLTVKHHDGYLLFPSQTTSFSGRTANGKDIVREFIDAMRAAGIRVGLFFSLSDWHHPDYPAFTEADKPYRFDQLPQPTAEQWEQFIANLFEQIRELLTNYGKIDLLWFDGFWERTPEQWHAAELASLIRQLQPDIIINDRLPGFGDYITAEQFVPGNPPDSPWEACLTMNESWAYNSSDQSYKSTRELIHRFCEIVGKGGRLLLNVSPMGSGELPPTQIERLNQIAVWLKGNQNAIVESKAGVEPWQFYGPTTRKDNKIHLFLLMRPYDFVTLRGVPIRQIKSVYIEGSKQKLDYQSNAPVVDLLMSVDPIGEIMISIPTEAIDEYSTVVTVEFKNN